jgi:hypothetical protein
MTTPFIKICGRVFTHEDIEQIQRLVTPDPSLTRAALSRQVCDLLGWYRPNGGRKDMSCRVALLKLHRQGEITLPNATRAIVRNKRRDQSPRDDQIPIAKPVDQLHGLTLLPVTLSGRDGRKPSQLWNDLIDRYHYLGHTPLVGAQRRYLIHSTDGWLGALGFSAAAWKVAPRDHYLGWTTQARQANLPYVVCNSRFLILPWVRCQNLASKVLALVAQRLARDWQQAYGYEPVLLETYVDQERFLGTCYRAANWIHVGHTQGRGKLDRDHRHAVPIKEVYLYPLHRHFRELLCRKEGLS